jgi:diaminopimelate decarboxylase/aspartate kinase
VTAPDNPIPASADWIVLKFGGTSVSNVANWRNIAAVVNDRLATGARVMVVHSAVSGITDRLEKLLASALGGAHEPVLAAIEERHTALATELGVGISPALQGYFNALREASAQIAATARLDDRQRAAVMANGELMATELGARFLATLGVDVQWLDARQYLKAEARASASARANYLSTTCVFTPDAAMRARLMSGPRVVLTQGFIASNDAGETVLLGRGGSDTSGAYFAAKLQARRCVRCITTKRRKSPVAAPRCCIRAASCRPSRAGFRCGSMPPRRRSSRAHTSVPAAAMAPRRSRPCA